jgi:hypothetical protein
MRGHRNNYSAGAELYTYGQLDIPPSSKILRVIPFSGWPTELCLGKQYHFLELRGTRHRVTRLNCIVPWVMEIRRICEAQIHETPHETRPCTLVCRSIFHFGGIQPEFMKMENNLHPRSVLEFGNRKYNRCQNSHYQLKLKNRDFIQLGAYKPTSSERASLGMRRECEKPAKAQREVT